MMDLHVVLRTCSRTSVHFKERFIPVSKQELIIHCLKSLVISLAQLSKVDHRIKLTIVDDHSDETCRQQMVALAQGLPFTVSFYSLEGTGNNDSMKATYLIAAHTEAEVVYIVEDDYLHCQEALSEMCHEYRYFQGKMRSRNAQAEVAIMPVDNRFHYIDEAIFSSPILLGTNRHWRVNFYSNMTLMLSRQALIDTWNTWWAYSDYQLSRPETFEDTLLTPVFRDKITLFTPIPTLAFHVAGHNYQSPFVSWEQVWIKVEQDYQKFRSHFDPSRTSIMARGLDCVAMS